VPITTSSVSVSPTSISGEVISRSSARALSAAAARSATVSETTAGIGTAHLSDRGRAESHTYPKAAESRRQRIELMFEE
jgi:hypothetical protein